MIAVRFMLLYLGSFLTILAMLPATVLAEKPSIALPLSEDADASTTIDGVWTTPEEWSKASETFVNYTDGTQLIIRGKHDLKSLYFLLEMPQDYLLDGHAAVCFDTLDDGGPYMKADDYCFVLGSTDLKEYHGDGRTTLMQESGSNQQIVASRGLSNENSPYKSDKNHVSYEFKVPMEYLGDHGVDYGFYVTYDTRGQTANYTYYYSWPDYKSASYLRVVSPRDWGQVEISSDTVVPEFPVPVIGIIAGTIGVVAVITRTRFLNV